MRAYVLTIGDELLYGERIDTNSRYLAKQLSKDGFELCGIGSVGDIDEEILQLLTYASTQAELILISGGLGPTSDDRTRDVLARFLEVPLLHALQLEEQLKEYARRRNRKEPYPSSLSLLPKGAEALSNPVGLVAGIWCKKGRGAVVALPGVPQELRAIYEQSLRPRLQEVIEVHKGTLLHAYCRTVGLTESLLALRLRDFEAQLPEAFSLAYLPRPAEVTLRLSLRATPSSQSQQQLYELHTHLQSLVSDGLYAVDQRGLVRIIAEMLASRGLRLCAAESCTGGAFARRCVAHSGASSYFVGGVIAYQNDIKRKLLGVSSDCLSTYGAVSREVVEAMARGAQRCFGVNVAVATSGVAGPKGGSSTRPVGMTWLAVAYKGQVWSECHHFASNRLGNIRYATAYLLGMLWKVLKSKA